MKGSGVYGCGDLTMYDDGNFIDYEEFSSDLKRKKDEDFIVGENLKKKLHQRMNKNVTTALRQKKTDEDEYLTDD